MKWLPNTIDAKQEIHEFWNGDDKLLRIYFHPASGTIRVNGNGDQEKRVFLIGKEGFLKNKLVLRNEYGVKVASLIHDNNQANTGTIEFDNTRLFFSVERSRSTSLLIFRETGEPVIHCELPSDLNAAFSYDHFALASCWFAFVSAEGTQVLEVA